MHRRIKLKFINELLDHLIIFGKTVSLMAKWRDLAVFRSVLWRSSLETEAFETMSLHTERILIHCFFWKLFGHSILSSSTKISQITINILRRQFNKFLKKFLKFMTDLHQTKAVISNRTVHINGQMALSFDIWYKWTQYKLISHK